MNAALLGFAGIVAGGVLALLGVLRTSIAPQHLADLEGLKALLDEITADRADLRVQLAACHARVGELEAANSRLADLLRRERGRGGRDA